MKHHPPQTRDMSAASESRDMAQHASPGAPDSQPYFCRGEFGMWRWIYQDHRAGAATISREAFSSILDCEKDAIRHRKYHRS
jgi:hypothetical protein